MYGRRRLPAPRRSFDGRKTGARAPGFPKSGSSLSFPLRFVSWFGFGKMKRDLGKRPSEEVLQGKLGEVAGGLQAMSKLKRVRVICMEGY